MKNAATNKIERDFPAWQVWVSRRGRYWGAVRRRTARDQVPTIIVDSEDDLRADLARQQTAPSENA